MIIDAAIIGSELDAFIASIRLRELGYSSNIISNGKGSHLYSSGNIKILGFDYQKNNEAITNPFNYINKLSKNHPYNIIGYSNVFESIKWFFNHNFINKLNYNYNNKNSYTLSPIGIKIPAYALYYKQINYELIYNKNISIINFDNFKDFHSHLFAKSIKNYVNNIEIINFPIPDNSKHSENSSIALTFDKHNDLSNYFIQLKKKLNQNNSIVIFPAVLGIDKYREIIKLAEKILNKNCLEASTLPPSVPGMRLNKYLEKEVLKHDDIYRGTNIAKAKINENKCLFITDNFGRKIFAKTFIFANGGILMGGLKVNDQGKIIEQICNSKIFQENPMNTNKSYETLSALQISGVVTNKKLKPLNQEGNIIENVFFTGRNLSNWNPSLELSSEGVSIASGWYSANLAAEYLNNK
tara:strand:+ start:449 stop:1681 length:1233 start_codon:yes stop_codon:yes gene_type:complete